METRSLQRSERNKVIAGVAGGLGEYFNVDPIIFRVILLLLALPGGAPGLLIYIILWVVMSRSR